MLPLEKLSFIEKNIMNIRGILLDYVSFSKKETIPEEEFMQYWKSNIGKHPTQFYLHIPYCSRICKYCMYSTIELKDQSEIDDYIASIISYLKPYVSLFDGQEFCGMYIGGGTPSILNLSQLRRLFEFIFSNFRFSSEYYNTIELNPTSTSLQKLQFLRSVGFDRISFGVQSFNKETLAKENRTFVDAEKMKLFIDYAKKLGFSDINTDLIFGLNSESEQEFQHSVEKILEVHPYSITIYTILKDMERSVLYHPDTNIFYQNILQSYENVIAKTGILEKYMTNDWSNLLGFKLISKTGYTQKGAYEAHSSEKVSLFGVGYKSFGRIWGIGSYETINKNTSEFGHIFEKKTAVDEVYSYILQKFQFQIDADDFRKKFSLDIFENFQKEIQFFTERNLLKREGNILIYTGPAELAGYYGLVFLDVPRLIKFIKYRYYSSGSVTNGGSHSLS